MHLCYNNLNYYGIVSTAAAQKQEKGGTALKILYFDLCSIPLFLLILITCYTRKMTKGNANRLFLAAAAMSLTSAAADLIMAVLAKRVPLSGAEFALETALGYVYLTVRNTSNAVVLLFLLSLTRMTSLLKKRWAKILYCVPNAVILLLLATNPFTHAVFTVTAEMGYARGPLMPVIYAMASLYGVCGFAFCMGLGRLWYGKKGQNMDLSAYMMGAGVLTFAAYLTASLARIPMVSLAGCMVSGLAVGIMWPGSISLTSARMPGGGTALFALLALAGDAGGTFGPSLVGLCTQSGGEDIQSGILAASVFPAILVLCLLAIRRKR